jgi:hypothetical protein
MPDDADRDALMAPLLPFQRQLVSELLDEDGLCIMSAGLGWQKVFPVVSPCLLSYPCQISTNHLRQHWVRYIFWRHQGCTLAPRAASEQCMICGQAVAVMLQLHIRRLQDPAESGIVLVLGCTDWQRDMLRAELRRLIPQLAQVVPVSLIQC